MLLIYTESLPVDHIRAFLTCQKDEIHCVELHTLVSTYQASACQTIFTIIHMLIKHCTTTVAQQQLFFWHEKRICCRNEMYAHCFTSGFVK